MESQVHPREGIDQATAGALKALLRRAGLRRDDRGESEIRRKLENAIEEARKEAESGEVWWGCFLNTLAGWWYLREPVDECLAWPYGHAISDGDGRGMRELKDEKEQAIRIRRVIRSPGGFDVEHDAACGDLYLRPLDGLEREADAAAELPVTLFLGTEQGFTYRLTLTPDTRPSA